MISTQGIKYIGSKRKAVSRILSTVDDLEVGRIYDAFSGTTRVSQALAKSGYTVISNDHAVWSKCFATAYLLNKNHRATYAELILHLNNLPGIDGWFTEHYGGIDREGSSVQPDGLKKLWQRHNSMKLDAIRIEIDRLNLSEITKAVILTSLILALDKVDSTLGHFSSYLREWSPRSYNTLEMKVPMLWINEPNHEVFCADIFDTYKYVKADLAYLDPPYGSNNKNPSSRVRYLAYYHIWSTIVLNDEPALFGKAARRIDTSDTSGASEFEEYRKHPDSDKFLVTESLDRMIRECPTRYVLMSYSTNGRITIEEIKRILHSNGTVIKSLTVDHPTHVMTNMTWTDKWSKDSTSNEEYLFLLEK